nr:MAG TPA: tape measure protein [Caudoviricetes sp.]
MRVNSLEKSTAKTPKQMAKADIQIVLQADGKPIDAIIKSTEGLQEAMKKALEESTKLKPSLVNAAATASLFQTLKSAVGSLQGVFSSYTQAFEAAAVANTKLKTIMEQRMNATAEDVKGVKDVISAQKELGVVSGSVQVAGAQQIGTFATQASTLRTLVPAMNNLLAQQKGVSATQEDAVAVGNLFGKALQGQATALRRVGITFSAAEEKMLKHGTESERAALLARIITNNVGEMNKKLAATPTGQMKQLQMTIGGIKAKIGEALVGFGPYLAAASQVSVITASFGQLKTVVAGVGASLANFLATTKASILALYAEAGAAGTTSTAMRVLTAAKLAAVSAAKKLYALMAANVWVVAIAAVAALAYALYKFSAANSEAARRQAEANEAVGVAAAAASKEESKLNALFSALNKAKQGTEAYAQAKNSIMDQYGEYIRQIQKEHGEIKDLAKMYDLLREKVVAAARARAMQVYVDKKMEGTAETRAELVKQLRGTLSTVFHGGNINKQLNEVLRNIDSGAEFREHYVKQFDKVITSGAPNTVVSQRIFNPFRDLVQKLRSLNGYEKQIRADADAALGVSPPPSSGNKKEKAPQNKAYWENLKKSAQDDLDNKDMSSATGRKEAAELRKKIAYYDKQLEFFSASSHGGGKSGGGKGGHKVDPKKEEENRQKNAALDAHALTQAQDKEEAAEIKAARERYAVLTQAEIDMKKEGAEKERAQNALDLQKELDQIDEQTAALLEAKRDQAEAVWNATHRKERDKGLRFNRSSITAANFSADEAAYFDKLREYARARRAAKDDATAEKYNIGRLEELHTVKELTAAIEKLNTASEKQSGDEFYNTQKTIAAYQRKLELMKDGAEWQAKLREAKEISQLGEREMKIRIEAIGIEELQSRIEAIQKRLADTTNPVSPEQRRDLIELANTYKSLQKKAVSAISMVRSAWGGVSSIGNTVESLSNTLRGNASAWQKLSAVLNAVLQMEENFKALNQVMRIFGLVSAANKTIKEQETTATIVNAQAVQTEAQTTIAAATAKTAANKAEATTNVAGAAAKTFNAHAAIPWVGIAAAAALTGVMIATMASLPKFAEGGIAYGPTLGLFGEYAGASHNPEVVAPLDRLRSLIAPQESSGGGSVRFRIEGRDLVGILQKVHRHNGRN